MIFVVLGTHELSFERLLKKVERLKKDGIIEDEIIAQTGNTNYESDLIKTKSFFAYEEMDKYYEKADMIITHGGTGSIIHGVKKGKKVIAVARLKEYDEHNDNHQIEIIEKFDEAGYILGCTKLEKLEDNLSQIHDFKPKKFKSKRHKIIGVIDKFIEREL